MAKTFRLPKEEPLLNIASYARGGPGAADRLTPSQIEQIRLTVNRAPEAVVKVLPRSSNDLKAVGKHIDYIGRRGNLELEGDDGERLRGRVGAVLLEDWDLDIDDVRRQGSLAAASKRTPPKIVHKLMFSMPPGTPPQKVLTAVRNLAREEFYGQHRYAMVLHTDEPHPHVHLVLKAVSEEGVRLNIKKATLRHWRSQFARQLRGLGVAANATDRVVRGKAESSLKDGIYRSGLRGESRYLNDLASARNAIGRELRTSTGVRSQKSAETRRAVLQGWAEIARRFSQAGDHVFTNDVLRFMQTTSARGVESERRGKEVIADKDSLSRSERARTR
ncbi:hypothetical protein GPROT2_00387 [Gammaproteobacteria bacterium]|nr:hypothetical protein GPROT2_00387 [Gammaproteobacteria bacterium]